MNVFLIIQVFVIAENSRKLTDSFMSIRAHLCSAAGENSPCSSVAKNIPHLRMLHKLCFLAMTGNFVAVHAPAVRENVYLCLGFDVM